MQRNILHQKGIKLTLLSGVLGAFSCITQIIHDFTWANNGVVHRVWKSQKKSHSTLRAIELCLHFEWTKVHSKCQKWSILASFWKPEACGQTMLPDRSVLIGQKLVENAENAKIQMCHIFCNWNWGWFGRNRRLITNDERSDGKKIDKKSFVIMFVRLREIVKNLAVKNSVRSRSAVVSCSSKTKNLRKIPKFDVFSLKESSKLLQEESSISS